MSGFFHNDTDKKQIKEDFLDKKARGWAESFLNPRRPKESWARNPRLTSAQLRRFHREVKEMEERVKGLEDPQADFAALRPMIKMLKSKVAYACPSNGVERKVPEEFRKYIEGDGR